jgi:catalase
MAITRKSKNAVTESAERPVQARYGDQSVELGSGGETHQRAVDDHELTTQQGTPVADDQNSLRAGVRGPALLEDFHFREKLFHFDHERIPERVVNARGPARMVSSRPTTRLPMSRSPICSSVAEK